MIFFVMFVAFWVVGQFGLSAALECGALAPLWPQRQQAAALQGGAQFKLTHYAFLAASLALYLRYVSLNANCDLEQNRGQESV